MRGEGGGGSGLVRAERCGGGGVGIYLFRGRCMYACQEEEREGMDPFGISRFFQRGCVMMLASRCLIL